MSRLRANQITNENANGAPNFPHGLTVTGIITATNNQTTFSNIVVGSAVTANSQGIDVTGVVTATSFKGNGANLTGIDETARSGIQIGAGGTIGSSGGGIVTYFGDGSQLSGVDATSLKDGSSNVIVQASSLDVVVSAGKTFKPATTNSTDLGTTNERWRVIYTNDLELSNKGSQNSVDGTWGDWTLQEGENDIFMINNRTNKKFKINMTEVE